MDIEAYKSEYAQTHPRPALSQLNPWRDARAWLIAFVIACGILVSALRTQGAFADVARTESTWLRPVESVAAAIVTELGMVLFMFERVRREREGQRLTWVGVGLAVCFAMSATANFDQGIQARFTAEPIDWATWGPWHVAILSVGIPVIVALTGEALGQHLAGVAAENERLRQAWQAEMDEWYRRLNAAWGARQRKAGTFRSVFADLSPKAPQVPSSKANGNASGDGQANLSLPFHFSAIAQAAGKAGGTFRRRDVEAWLGLRPTQAWNALRYGREQGLIEALPRNRYRLAPHRK